MPDNLNRLVAEYFRIFFEDGDLNDLDRILSPNLDFRGPFVSYTNARDYIEDLKRNPPREVKYEILSSFQIQNAYCVRYLFSKPGIGSEMIQTFELEKDLIIRIRLFFSKSDFGN